MSAGWIFTKPPKGKPPGFSARWATMSGMSLALAPSSSKVMGIPREWKKRHSFSMPWRAVLPFASCPSTELSR